MVKKAIKQKETINNLEIFYKSREEVINFFRDYIEILSDANYDAKQNETKGKGLENGENLPRLEITEVVLIHCNIVNNDSQQDSRVLYTFVPNKPFGSLLETSPTNYIF